jgi:DNA polymerase III alpha subunit
MTPSSDPHTVPAYAELHCLSNFSFQRGASQPEELVERAAALGYGALAITDECSVAGVVRAHVQAKASGLKLLLGGGISGAPIGIIDSPSALKMPFSPQLACSCEQLL